MESLQDKLTRLKTQKETDVWYLVKQELNFMRVATLVNEWKKWKDSKSSLTIADYIEGSRLTDTNYRALTNAYNYGLMRNDNIVSGTSSKPSYKVADSTPVWEELSKVNFADVNTISNIIDRQIEKLYISNPYDDESKNIRKSYRLFIVPTIYAILIELKEKYNISTITKEEFILFVETTKKFADYTETASLINEYREQRDSLDSIYISKLIKGFNNRVHLALKNLSLLRIDKNLSLSLEEDKIPLIRERLDLYQKNVDRYENLTSKEIVDIQCSTSSLWNCFEENNEDVSNKESDKKVSGGENIIFYGAPGTGKSHDIVEYINEKAEKYFNRKFSNDTLNSEENIFRITLYPDYEYSDFVGQLLPQKDGTFEYKKGIFSSALQYAQETDDPVFMILEEMSRANVASVFGDLFQLLDRKEDGSSEYGINNSMLAEMIYPELSKENINKKVITLPSNLYIIGTVNTSDQNVFAMDTAFKRRFIWKYKSTDVDPSTFKNNPYIKLFKEFNINWYHFYTTINTFITDNLNLSEDKQIGPYFIKFNTNNDSKIHSLLRDKLLQYLWEDVDSIARNNYSNEDTIFSKDIKSFSTLYEKFDNQENIFSDTLTMNFETKKEE
ncbi:McrB family protein [Ligilactobacillus salivarius]|uniref:McrB family protein n=1 Tax=Ligilactobacillus salivarius TaxID=1624 RepID=UPI0030FC7E91